MSNVRSGSRHRGPGATLALAWLAADPTGADVLMTARNMLAAEDEARRVLPPAIGAVVKVARLDGQRITLAVPSGAYASKLRQLGPRLLQRLNHTGWNLTEIAVRVQGKLSVNETSLSRRQVEPLGDGALQAFGQLAAGLPPGPLSDAVANLLRRHA